MTRLPVLTYHAIAEAPSPLAISPEVFASTMARLSRAGWRSLTERDALQGLRQGRWPERSFLLHFDDGFTSVKEHAWPVLRDAGFTATIFVVTDWVGRTNDWPGQPSSVPRWPLMTWDDLSALAGNGAALGAHTASHPRLPQVSNDRQEEEIGRSFEAIAARCGEPARVFAYPYGAVDTTSASTALRRAAAAYGTRLGFVTPSSPRGALPRIDAYYLGDGRRADVLDGAAMRAWLAVRHGGRLVRGLLPR